MFFRLFRNAFLIDHFPNEIKINFNTKSIIDECREKDANQILDYIYDFSTESNQVTFYQACEDFMVNNAIIQQYCLKMGLDYEIYSTILDHSDFYTRFCVTLYEPDYVDHFRRLEPKHFSYQSQCIPEKWNVGELPFEFLVNHIDKEEYAEFIYLNFLHNYIFEENITKKLSLQEQKDPSKYALKDFLNDDTNNLCFNDEFSLPLINKSLIKLLIEKKYIIKSLKTSIKQEEYPKHDIEKEKPNYDNESIYESISRYRGKFTEE